MLKTLSDLYASEDRNLAPYAMKNQGSRGRTRPEPSHPFRTEFQRDRDRVLHSRPFRRLEYKTQVFLNDAGDHYRTRLTHTIEMAAIVRTVARVLGLNEDLAETISLAHDLGHPPFGHTGERRLNALTLDHGGFDHNAQAIRIVDVLEHKYPGFDGLNLTWEVRAGLIKHRVPGVTSLDGELLPPHPSLESQVADLADDLTYYGHDTDDGLESGLFAEAELDAVELWREAAAKAEAQGLRPGVEKHRSYAVRCLIDSMVGNLVRHSDHLLESHHVGSPDQAREFSMPLIAFSPDFAKKANELREFLYANMYFNPKVLAINNHAANQVEELFHFLLKHPERLGKATRDRVEHDGLHRAVADYIAGMTDRFAMHEHANLKG